MSCFCFVLSSVSQDENDGIAAKEHFRDEAVFVDGFLAFALGHLCPHLLYIFENHVRVTIKGFDSCKELLVVAKCDEDLGVVANGLLKQRERALGDLVLLELADLGLIQFGQIGRAHV